MIANYLLLNLNNLQNIKRASWTNQKALTFAVH